jgi:uncharacterized protein YjbI with pentapeptide repeats
MAESKSPRFPVRPRAVSQLTGERLFLEDFLEPFLQGADCGAICIFGERGSGKSTALRYLSDKLPRRTIVELLDDPTPNQVTELAERMVVIYTASAPHPGPHLANAWLAPWGEDEALDYLLSAHKEKCASIMRRLRAGTDRDPLDLPELWTICLDRMAEDEALADVDSALRRHLDRLLSPSIRSRAREICLTKTLDPELKGVDEVQLFGQHGFLGFLMGAGLSADDVRLVRDPRIRRILAAERLVDPSDGSVLLGALEGRLPEQLVSMAGRVLGKHPKACAELEGSIRTQPARQAMGASLLHAAGIGWKPKDSSPMILFREGYFRRAPWAELKLPIADFCKADLSGANLRGASLNGVNFREARLPGANLSESSLLDMEASGADLRGAELCGVAAPRATFRSASLHGTDLTGASLPQARFFGADLTKARFCRADLKGAQFQAELEHVDWLTHANTYSTLLLLAKKNHISILDLPTQPTVFDETDFTGADLQVAHLQFADLRTAKFSGALMMGADLYRSNLEGVEVRGAHFDRARLVHAVLTGSVMPGGSFHSARLGEARLADVDWERADLRDADLRKAIFHLGTSRSGLVFGEPSEGTRNGFYTDEFGDQSFRAPEEIRVANLRGADLRGALIEGTDFYLVDVREARVSPEQEDYLRRCGAILESRV